MSLALIIIGILVFIAHQLFQLNHDKKQEFALKVEEKQDKKYENYFLIFT